MEIQTEEQNQNKDQTTDGPVEVTKEDVQEMLDSVKIDDSDEDIEVKKVDKTALKKVDRTGGMDPETLALYEEFGTFLKVKADIIPDSGVKKLIPTGIDVLDAALGGGFPVGAMSMIVGAPGSGKSMLAIQTIGAAQQKYKGCLASYLDSEEATTTARLVNLGIKYPPIEPFVDITVEKVFKHLEAMCLFKEKKGINDIPSILCWDSIANTLSQKEREAEDVNSVIGYKARMLSLLVPKYVAKCAKHGIAWITVNQLRDDIQLGQFPAPKQLRFLSTGKTLPGGNVLRFNAFTLLELKTKSVLDPEKYGFDGMLFTITTVKNKFMPPNITIELIGDYVRGFNNYWTSFHFLTSTKRMGQGGGWYWLANDPDQKKFRAKGSDLKYYENTDFKQKFDVALQEAVQIEIIDKYNPDI